MIEFKGIKYYNELKKLFDENFMPEWESMSGRSFVGGCSDVYQKYKPNSMEEFFNEYTTDYDINYDYNTHKGSMKLGRSEEQFKDLAEFLLSKVSKKDTTITFDMCFDAIINYVLVSTYLGHLAERKIVDKINSLGNYDIIETKGDLDAIYGIDIVVKKKGSDEIVSYIQVKPLSAFYHEKYKTRRWVKDYYKKQSDFNSRLISEGKQDKIKEIKYVVYDYKYLSDTGKVRYLCKGDRLRFSISELCDNNGNILLTKDDLVFKEI